MRAPLTYHMRLVYILRSLLIIITTVLLFSKSSLFADTITSVRLSWTASGDDGDIGTASQYDLRYRADGPITGDSTFYLGIVIPTQPPSPAGVLEECIIELPAGEYYFAIKVADDALNWSELSNIIMFNVGVFPPDSVYFLPY